MNEKFEAGHTAKIVPLVTLPMGVVASEEEFAHLEHCLNNPKGPSPAILRGAALLREIREAKAPPRVPRS